VSAVAAVVMMKRITGARALSRSARRNPESNCETPRFKLTDKQRDEISRLSGIPKDAADAWQMIESCIERYRSRKAHRQYAAHPAEIRKELQALSTATFKLYHRLYLLTEHSPPDLPVLSFKDELGMLREVEKQLFYAASDIVKANTGPSTHDVYILVGILDGIREEFTGKKITRSAKRGASREYVRTTSQIADADIRNGTIEEAMKRRINRRGGFAGKFQR
jgi:hypothetical protein